MVNAPSCLTKAADVSIQPNVVQVGLSGNHFSLILLAPILQVVDRFLPVGRIVVKVDLSIHAEYWVGQGQGLEYTWSDKRL